MVAAPERQINRTKTPEKFLPLNLIVQGPEMKALCCLASFDVNEKFVESSRSPLAPVKLEAPSWNKSLG